MKDKIVTIEIVRMARNQLIDSGQVASDRKIRKVLGFGSPNTINRFNRELREEELREQLAREAEFPTEIRAAYVASLTKRVSEDTAAIMESLQETEQCLRDTVEQLVSTEDRIDSLEATLGDAKNEKTTLNETIARKQNEREVAEATLSATISEKTSALKTIIGERDALLDKVRELTIDAARLSEATRMHKDELDSLKQEFHRLEHELHAEQTKAAVAERECSLMRDNLDEKNVRIREHSQEAKEWRVHVHQLQEELNKARSAKEPSQAQTKGHTTPPAK